MKKQLQDKFEQLAAESPVLMVFLVFLITAALVVPASMPFFLSPAAEELKINLVAESYGILLDLLILGWLLLWLSNVADRRERKNRYREEIEDALGWRSPVASHRIVSNVRRLNRAGVTEELELPEAYLKGASLENVKLKHSNLWGAHLGEAALRGAELSGALLAGADLEDADLENARLEGADLRGADLRAADMERAHIVSADLRGADLRDADLQYATLRGVELERANLSGINLRGATLESANLGRATLHEANLTGAELTSAHLQGADFTGARLREADLRGATLSGVCFRAADLSGVQLGDADLDALGEVDTLYEAALDDALRERLQEAHPHLFEAPGGNALTEQRVPGNASSPAGDGAVPLPAAPDESGGTEEEAVGEANGREVRGSA